MNTTMPRRYTATNVAIRTVLLACFAAALSACAGSGATAPTVSESSPTTGLQLQEGMLSNGLLAEPYAG